MDQVAIWIILAIEVSGIFNPDVRDGIKAAGRFYVTLPVLAVILGMQLFCRDRYGCPARNPAFRAKSALSL